MSKAVVVLIVLLGFSFSAFAEKDFSSWRKYSQADVVQESTAVAPGGVFWIGLRLKMAPGWHTYWVNPGDSGAALHLSFDLGRGLRVRRVLMPFPQRYETGPLISFGYEKEVIFPIEIEADSSLSLSRAARVKLDAEWLVCEDVCLPASQTLTADLLLKPADQIKPSEDFTRLQAARARVPQVISNFPAYVDQEKGVQLKFMQWRDDEYDFVDFFPFKGSGVSNEAPHIQVLTGELKLDMSPSTVPRVASDRVGVLVARKKSDGTFSAWQFGDPAWTFESRASNSGFKELWWMLLSAFLGGLILNLMPCVFPVLSIKLLSVLKAAAHHPQEVRRQNLAYVAGVLVSFVSAALVLSLFRSAGTLVGWGFQLQSPLFLALLIWLFFALSLNLLGLYEISFLDAGLGHRLTRLGGMWGSFFTGVLAVVVASPCTAPFMGVALGFGLSQPAPILIAIFSSLGLGLAFPYLLFAIYPTWVAILPRPGAWMNSVKKVMAVPLLATVVWLAWVLEGVRGTPALAAIFGAVIVLGLCIWFGKKRGYLSAVVASFSLFVALGYVSSLESGVRARSRSGGEGIWKAYNPQILDELKGQNVFVNMTADWCLTCKVNERLVFNDLEVQEHLKKKGVVAIKGDWTERDEDITRFLTQFGRVGVPFYVLYSPRHPEGLALPEVLTKSTFIEYLNSEFP